METDQIDNELERLRLDSFAWDSEGSLAEAAQPLLATLALADSNTGGPVSAQELVERCAGAFLTEGEPFDIPGMDRLLAARIELIMNRLVRAGFAWRLDGEIPRWSVTDVGQAVLDTDYESHA